MTACDIVLPVFNRLSLLRKCVTSILSGTDDVDWKLVLVDDASDVQTRAWLDEVAAANTRVELLRNTENVGFVQSCNRGIAVGTSPFVVLVNSDVVVPPRWLGRLLECAESDPKIGSVNPLTNHAALIDVPPPPGASFLDMDSFVEQHAPRAFPDVVTGVGFCMLLRRLALDDVGTFDQIFGRGYCEESDLCMRLTTNGWRTVVADHVYVYHRGRGSFVDREELYRRNRRIFDDRWADEHRRQFRAFEQENPLGPVRELFALPTRWNPRPAKWTAAREMLTAWRGRQPAALARAAARGAFGILRSRRPVPSAEAAARFTRSGTLRVTYVANELVVAGGVLSVLQLVNELTLLGVTARVAARYADPAIADFVPLFVQPIVYANESELIDEFPESDIVVATHHVTAPWVGEILARGCARHGVYFLQDFEPWFFPESDREARARVLDGYRGLPSRIVKSEWLAGMLREHDLETERIALGMDSGMFYPRNVVRERPTVLAMARPRTPRRGFETLVAALAQLHAARPDVEIALFGDRFLGRHDVPFPFRDEGVVISQDRLAELYSGADVFVDASDFQGFGRCALEAMACGAACVVTPVGGVTEYAEDNANCLTVEPCDVDGFATAIRRLLEDDALRTRLIGAGRATAERFDHEREARETLAYFERITADSSMASRRS